MKKLIVAFSVLLCKNCFAQIVTKYYDMDWQEVIPGKAMYYAEFTKVETGYKCFSYWVGTQKKREESFYADSSMTKPNGLKKVYCKNGNIEDSIFINPEGKLTEAFHFYANRQLECRHVADSKGSGSVVEAYDKSGQKIKSYVCARGAEPKGGVKGWYSFLQKKLPKN